MSKKYPPTRKLMVKVMVRKSSQVRKRQSVRKQKLVRKHLSVRKLARMKSEGREAGKGCWSQGKGYLHVTPA